MTCQRRGAFISGRRSLANGKRQEFKNRPRLVYAVMKDDRARVGSQLRWLNELMNNDEHINLIVGHDIKQIQAYIRAGTLGNGFKGAINANKLIASFD